MALRTVDLTKQPYKAVFVGCSEDEVNYAKTFWQSVQLLPPMESRLVSSDIKQRLRKAPHSRSMSEFLIDDECHLWHGLSYSHANGTFTMKLVGGPTIEKRIGDGKDDNYPNIERTDTNIGPICQILGLGGAGREVWSRHPDDTSEGHTDRHLDALELGGEELSRNRLLFKWGEAQQLTQRENQWDIFEFGGEDLRGVRTRPQEQDRMEGSCFKIKEMLFVEKDAKGIFKSTTLPLKNLLLEENNTKGPELSNDSAIQEKIPPSASCDQFSHIKIADIAENKKLGLLTEPQKPEGKRMQKKTFTSAQENVTKSRISERKRTSTGGPYLSHKPLPIRKPSKDVLFWSS